jgi:hypothetical protein
MREGSPGSVATGPANTYVGTVTGFHMLVRLPGFIVADRGFNSKAAVWLHIVVSVGCHRWEEAD